jgi:hypothetical protein
MYAYGGRGGAALDGGSDGSRAFGGGAAYGAGRGGASRAAGRGALTGGYEQDRQDQDQEQPSFPHPAAGFMTGAQKLVVRASCAFCACHA